MKYSYPLKSESKSESGTLVEGSTKNWCGQSLVWCAVGVTSNDNLQDVGGSAKVPVIRANGPFMSYGISRPETTAEFHCPCAEESRLRFLHPAPPMFWTFLRPWFRMKIDTCVSLGMTSGTISLCAA